MKAISLWQPWASLVVLGLKEYETRSWKTNYRGTLVVHAALTENEDTKAGIELCESMGIIDIAHLVRGVALGTVELVDIQRTEDVLGREVCVGSPEEHLGNYAFGRYAWKLANPIRFAEPIPCAGHQRLWEVGDHANGQT